MRKAMISTVLMLALLFTAFPAANTAFALSNDNAVIRMSGKINNGGISVDVNLIKNDGISAMNLELVYDDTALTLVGAERGTALNTLQYLTTNTETEQGYSIKPFKFDYSGDDNDYSTGKLFTLSFKVKDGAKDGKYVVTLKYKRNSDVNYIENGELKTRNLSVDSVEIKTEGSMPAEIATVSETDEQSLNLPLIIISAGFAAAGVSVAVFLFLRKRKRWKKI